MGVLLAGGKVVAVFSTRTIDWVEVVAVFRPVVLVRGGGWDGGWSAVHVWAEDRHTCEYNGRGEAVTTLCVCVCVRDLSLSMCVSVCVSVYVCLSVRVSLFLSLRGCVRVCCFV